MRVSWLADVLHDAGLPICPLDGWRGRGRDLIDVKGVVAHHTATRPSTADHRVAELLRDGRPDLAGPLAQLGLDRQGRWWLIADGKCNHNIGEWGNQSIGVEAFNDGRGEPWPTAQLDSWVVGTAAILRHLGYSEGHVLAHRETDPSRKTDPAGVDMNLFRRNVADLLRPPAGKDDMRYPETGYDVVTVAATGKGFKLIPVPFDAVTGLVMKTNDDGTIPTVELALHEADDGKAIVRADGAPGNVGFMVGYRSA